MTSSDTKRIVAPKKGVHLLNRSMELVDLSRQLHTGMPIWFAHQKPFIFTNQTHEEFKNTWNTCHGFETRNLLISEHTGTHTDALFEISPEGGMIDEMPLGYFFGDGICLDLQHVRYPDYITVDNLEEAVEQAGREIPEGGHVLLYTGHGDRTYPTNEYLKNYTGLNESSTAWLAEKGAVNICIDSSNIDHADNMEFPAHVTCTRHGVTNTEGLTNLHLLLNRRFTYFGLPLNIRDGTGSPIRAVAWLHD